MKRLWALFTLLAALSPAQEPADSSVSANSSSSTKNAVQYIPLPPNATPLSGIAPKSGVAQNPQLMKPPRSEHYDHDIDFESREMEVKKSYVNPISRDTMEMWSATYPELASYVSDMYDIGFNRLWLNSFAGQNSGGYTEPESGTLYDIDIPINMPSWMKDFGFDKPKLMLQGTMDIRLSGRGEKDDAPGSTKDNLFPSPTLHYDPSFMVKGKIGPYITVEVNNVESGLGAKNQIRVVYEESYKGEFEDYILQRIEAGTTSLALPGTELTGYSENHKGLFGIKAEWKLGDWNLTTIASQDGGNQEKYTINASSSTTEFQIQDKQFIPYRYYFINQEARKNYISAGLAGRSTASYEATNLKLYKRAPTNVKTDVIQKVTAIYKTESGAEISKVIDRLVPMNSNDYSYDSKTGIVKVLGAGKSTLIAASWSNDGTGRAGSTVNDQSKVVLIQWDATLAELVDIDKLMLRNVYSVGISDESASSFVLRLKNKAGVSSSYLKTLGLVDTTTNAILTGDATIFKKDASGSYTGEMWVPCRPLSWYHGANSSARAHENCLEPFRNIDSTSAMEKMYTLPVSNLSRYTSRFYFESVGKKRNSVISVRDPNSSYSVSSGTCMDISEGSEKLKAGSTVLTRGVDYDVNYELGQIELLSETALDPNKEISVEFECEPLFEIDNKVLLGARAELPLTRYGFGEGSLFGVTALYKSQSTTASTPTLGNEPYSSFLWGMNLRLQDTTKWMTDLVNMIPGINTTAASNWRFETEFASSYHDANTSASRTALLEDFESSENGLVYPLTRLSWYQASPPGGVDTDPSTYIESQDYKHKGEFIWHSNNTELYKHIYPSVGNSDVDNQRLTVLKFTLRPNDNLSGNSWGGVMRPNSSYYEDLSDMKYIEVVARGNVGSLYLDLGLVSEDLSISGDAPNGEYDGENQLGTTTALHDKGLDGVTGSEEHLTIWDCRMNGCVSTTKTSANSDATNTDIARDNFDDDLDDESDPPVTINGTENNSGERTYDTEDINKNGSLDTDISFVRYRVDLSDNDKTHFEELSNGWRRWTIPLDQFDTLVTSSGENYKTILSQAQFTRLWFGKINNGVAEAKAQIVKLGVMGNAWESSDVSNKFVTTSSGNTQTAVIDGSEVDISSDVSSSADTTHLSISTINNRENSGTYYKSPNTKTERDAETNAALKETALVLKYKDLTPGQSVGATRIFDSDKKDLTKYKTLKMEIHYETDSPRTPVRFALQFGEGSLEGSSDYYEWSFRPVKITCTAAERAADCHERNWLANAFAEKLSAFSDLKRGRRPPYLTPVVDSLGGEREEVLKLVGNPSTTSVDWIRFVVIADEDASPADLSGEFWIDDIRLSDMDNDWGYAFRTSGQANFSDFFSISGSARYQDGNFATLSTTGNSPKPALSEAASTLDLAADASMNLNKFLPDEQGFHMPVSVGYSSTTERPYLKPTDDLELSHDNLGDFAKDTWDGKLSVKNADEEQQLRDDGESRGYESFSRTRRFSFSYSKDYKMESNPLKEILSQVFLERPAWSYSYTETQSRATTSADSTYSYHTIIEYSLGTFNRFNYKPFSFLKDSKWAKSFTDASFEPWPQTIDLTLFDLSYIRYVNQERDPDYVEPQVDKKITYTVDLSHKANVRWNIFPFLTTSYSLNITRDMFGGGDQQSFTKENFWSPDNGGLFASDNIFDYDHTDRKIYVSPDSIVVVPYDTVAVVSAEGDTSLIDMDDPTTYKVLYDSTVYYKVDSVGSREYGRAYGILKNERSRAQQFKTTFSPAVIPFLPMTFSFSSSFKQQKTIPDEYDLYDPTMVEKNYWTITQTNRFEFSPSFRIVEFLKLFGDKNAAAGFFEKLRWRDVKAGWTVDMSTVGENFTLAQLYEEQGVTPMQYYLYGLGIGNGYRNRGIWNIVSGDMELDDRDDYTRFAQYRNGHVDTLVYQGSFTHAVSRTLNLSTGFTLPFWNIGIVADMQWKQDFSQSREYPLYTDSTIVWPKWGVGVTIPNFSQRVGFLNGFRSVSTTHRVDYTYTRSVKPFQAAEDSWTTQWNFNPLIRISFLTQQNIRIEDNTFLKLEFIDRRPKQEVISQTNWPNTVENLTDTTEFYYTPWIPTALYKDFGYNVGNDLTISYPLKTKRGFQFWKWYFKLQNDIDLRFTAGYEYTKTIREVYEPGSDYNMWEKESGTDGVYKTLKVEGQEPYVVYFPKLTKTERTVPSRVHEWYVRPSAGYQFNKMASMSAYVEYRQIHEKLDDETAHTTQILSFEIALLLRFN